MDSEIQTCVVTGRERPSQSAYEFYAPGIPRVKGLLAEGAAEYMKEIEKANIEDNKRVHECVLEYRRRHQMLHTENLPEAANMVSRTLHSTSDGPFDHAPSDDKKIKFVQALEYLEQTVRRVLSSASWSFQDELTEEQAKTLSKSCVFLVTLPDLLITAATNCPEDSTFISAIKEAVSRGPHMSVTAYCSCLNELFRMAAVYKKN